MNLPNTMKRSTAARLVFLCWYGAATVACSSDDASDDDSSAGSGGKGSTAQNASGATAKSNSSTGATGSTNSGSSAVANPGTASSGGAGNGGNPGTAPTGATGGSQSGPAGGSAVGVGGGNSTNNPGDAGGSVNGPGGNAGNAALPSGGSSGTASGINAGGSAGNTTTASGSSGGSSDTALGNGGSAALAGNAGNAGSATGGNGTSANVLPQIPSNPLPSVETESFTPSSSTVDIADDCAIYANPSAPELSVVVADNKDEQAGGVGVFDMQGKLLQFRQEGQIGNVDLRVDFPFGGQSIVLVGANNRTTKQLNFWQLDPSTRTLSAPIGKTPQSVTGSYGFCMYHSKTSGKFYAFVTEIARVGAQVEQYELSEANGQVAATRVRSFALSNITEGCVADDDLGWLYVAEEDVALWRYAAEPSAGSDPVQVAAVGDGKLVADLEGISLAKGPGTTGYLVLSLQSEDRFAIFDRETNAYLRGFSVGANGSIDVANQTDGLDISTANLGPGFPHGALVVHDGNNADGASSNLKFIPLQ